MKQVQKPVPPPSEEEGEDLPVGQRQKSIDAALARAEDVTNSITEAIEEDARQKVAPMKCCGRLPCKGRTLACYGCDICMDCITGAGCGHNDSSHEPRAAQTLD